MARIALITVPYGMTLASAQLTGELLRAGHDTKVIFFKLQEALPSDDVADNPDYQLGDIPMRGYTLNEQGELILHDYALWRTLKPRELRHLVSTLKAFQPDAIGISCLSHSMALAEAVTDHLRQHFDSPILWGGAGPTLEPERAIARADLVCVGEGEGVLIDIANRLDAQSPLDGITGTWHRQADGSVQKNPKRAVSDLERIAVPEWRPEYYTYISGLKFEHNFHPNTYKGDKSYQIMTQRGCPFSCSFCIESWYQDEFGKKGSLRRMSPGKALHELKIAKEVLGYKTVTFMDDVFTINPRWLKAFLPRYRQEIGLPFFCYTYPSTHTPEILALLRDNGCHAITMGIQSGSERILTEFFNRPTHFERIIEATREIVDSGIPAATFDMIPHTLFDREDDLRKTLDLLLEIPKPINATFFSQMAYFPGYAITKQAKDQSVLASSEALPETLYHYYFKLYNLTRTPMAVTAIRDLAADPVYRHDHRKLNRFLVNQPSVQNLRAAFGELTEIGLQRKQAAQLQHAP